MASFACLRIKLMEKCRGKRGGKDRMLGQLHIRPCPYLTPPNNFISFFFGPSPFFFFNFYLFIYLFIYVFIYGCVGSSFLCEGFL